MYEPVTDDTHVTILKPNFVIKDYYEQQCDIDIEDLSKTDISEENLNDEQPVASREDLIQPPEKPPRRNKLKRLEKMRQDSNCIDIEHINLESERNYKNRFKSISIQTSPIVPYRLRIFPKMCSVQDEKFNQNQFKTFCRILSQLFLSQFGLTITLITWALLGAAGFYNTEGISIFNRNNLYKLIDALVIMFRT